VTKTKARPDDRPLRRLPQLAPRKATLERCVFCPKLCRAACPVSNAEPRETVTPWGKMSMAYFVANESVPLARSFAEPAWACTGCFGCREQCDHKNDVAGTLFEARSALLAAGEAPDAARRARDRFAESARVLAEVTGPRRAEAKIGVLVGCEHARRRSAASTAAIPVTERLLRQEATLVDACCGAPLLYAGDIPGFVEQGARFAAATAGNERIVALDAGCAAALRVHLPAHGRKLEAPLEHLVELAARSLPELGRLDAIGRGAVRWHDPCQLGRGLGVYEAPRQILGRILGRAPEEFPRRREHAQCSGAGGLLPLTMPRVAGAIAEARVREHDEAGGGTIVTACASSARSLARAGASQVLDLSSLILRALER
jgi:Fe-S oxidoreductase